MLHAAAVLSGSVFIDADDDGTRDANEVGVPGVVIRLADSNSSDTSTNRSMLTNDNGFYSFDELEPGTYQLSKRQTPATIDGQDSTFAPGATSSNNLFTNLVLADDQTLADNNFGSVPKSRLCFTKMVAAPLKMTAGESLLRLTSKRVVQPLSW